MDDFHVFHDHVGGHGAPGNPCGLRRLAYDECELEFGQGRQVMCQTRRISARTDGDHGKMTQVERDAQATTRFDAHRVRREPPVERIAMAVDLRAIVRVALGHQAIVALLKGDAGGAEGLAAQMIDERVIGTLGDEAECLGAHHPVVLFVVARAKRLIERADQVENHGLEVDAKPVASGYVRPAREARAGFLDSLTIDQVGRCFFVEDRHGEDRREV